MTDAPRAVVGAHHGSTDARRSGPSLRKTARSKDPPTPPVQTAPPGVLSGPIAPAMLRLALPTIVVLVVQTLVGVTETYFVSFLGTEALAGVALVFPVLMLVQMMSNGGIGGGVASAVAQAVGANRGADAQALAWHAMLLACGLGLLFTMGAVAGGPALYRAMGGTDETLAAALTYSNVALLGIRGGDQGSRDERPDERGEEGLSPPARVVDHLEEGEVERQLLLRDAAVRAQPGAQQRPGALQRVDVDLAEPVAILVARVLATPVTDRLVAVAPLLQAAVDAVLVGVHEGALGDAPLDDGPDRHLPDVGQHAQDDLAAALEQAEDRRLVLGERAPAGRTPQPPASAGTPPLETAAGWPLWPATT